MVKAKNILKGGEHMLSIEDLRKIYLLDNLNDEMLEKIRPIVQLRLFEERNLIFKEGQEADCLYMLLKGKIILEVNASESIMISLGAVKPGYSFGWSALFQESIKYTSSAICVEPCEVMAVPGEKLLELFDEDHSMGHFIMEGVVGILKGRLERRTGQFLEAIKNHPDIQKLFST